MFVRWDECVTASCDLVRCPELLFCCLVTDHILLLWYLGRCYVPNVADPVLVYRDPATRSMTWTSVHLLMLARSTNSRAMIE